MQNSKSIGNKIAAARKKLNLSQADLAQKVSISSQAVGKWERNESMPDITTLNRLAEILGVDLNYFSDSFQSDDKEVEISQPSKKQLDELPLHKPNKKFGWSWNMSSGNWVDADFSGLKNLQEKFSSSNMKNCKFLNSDLSGLILGKNNIEKCDFSTSDIRDSKLQSSNLLNNQFNNCSFIDAEFLKSNIEKCNFSEANFSGAEFNESCFENNIVENAVWKFTSFKNTGISAVVFEGTIEDCHFENCTFYRVKFQNATILNSFFKNNSKLNRVQFINCKVDKMTYAFLKNNATNLTGITLI
ncbi:MAG: pentapeptide repeat-containing protein [Bacteroidetes bacterium]|nr:pentapeptide repeat-containing protein [Bacteroidota bacterium]